MIDFVAGLLVGAGALGLGFAIRAWIEGRRDPEIDKLRDQLAHTRGDVALAATMLGSLLGRVAEATGAGEIPPATARSIAIEFEARYPNHSAAQAVRSAAEMAEAKDA